MYLSGHNQIKQIIDNIVNDYKKVSKLNDNIFGGVTSLDDVQKIIEKYSDNIDELRELFVKSGIEFKEEIHVSKVNGKYAVNETINFLQRVFADLDSTKAFMQYNLKRFKEDGVKAIKTVTDSFAGTNVDVNKVIEAYFLSDVLFTNDYNRMMVGQVFAHPAKGQRSITDIAEDLGVKNATSDADRDKILKDAKKI